MSIADIIRIVFSALAPVAALIVLLLVVDRHEREPAKLLIKQFIVGCLISIPAIFLERWLEGFNWLPDSFFGLAFSAYIVAAMSEESLKWGSVHAIAYKHAAFNEKLDGIIYCAFTSLGFAAVENVMYVVSYIEEDPTIALYRAIFSVPGHMLFAVTMGYYMSLSKFAPTFAEMKRYRVKSLLYPILLHGTFNFILSFNINWLYVFIPFVVFLWIYNIIKLRKFSKESRYYHTYDPNNYDPNRRP